MTQQILQKGMDEISQHLENAPRPPIKLHAADRMSLEAAKTRFNDIKTFCKQILKEGTDYGQIPGVNKKILHKPGAEKILMFLMLRPEFKAVTLIEDYDKPLFYYRYECNLYHINSGVLVGSGIGSCNSMEKKWRWRNAKHKCPHCGAEQINKSKFPDKTTGELGWYCYAKMGGCGAQFTEFDPAIVNQVVGKVPNEDIFDLVNTLDKMAQKRAMLAPTLVVSGLSEEFTMDLEDFDPPAEQPRRPAETYEPPPSKPKTKTTKPKKASPPETKNPPANGKAPSSSAEPSVNDSSFGNSPLRVQLRKLLIAIQEASGKDEMYTFAKVTETNLNPDELNLLTKEQLDNSIARGMKILSQFDQK